MGIGIGVCVWGGGGCVRVCVLNKNMFISTLINYLLDCTNFGMYRVYTCMYRPNMYVCVYVCVCVCVCSSLYSVPQVQRV